MKMSLKNFQEGMHWQKMQNIKQSSFCNKRLSYQENESKIHESKRTSQKPSDFSNLPMIATEEHQNDDKRINQY